MNCTFTKYIYQLSYILNDTYILKNLTTKTSKFYQTLTHISCDDIDFKTLTALKVV